MLREIRVMEDEPKRMLARVRERAREIARGSTGRDVDCLHILIALTRLRDAFAYRLLERCGTPLTALRNVAVSYVTGNMPRRYRTIAQDTKMREPIIQPRTKLVAPRVLERGHSRTFAAIRRSTDGAGCVR
ncbi:MAG: Clp protease N-terminal domain-containing protein [Myxococcota bacterium]